MFKQKQVKGHGTLRKLRTGAIVSVLSMTIGGVGVVSADEVGSTVSSPTVGVEEKAPVTSQEVKPVVEEAKPVTAEDVKSAEVAVASQEGVVTSLKQEVATTENTVNTVTNEIQEVSALDEATVAKAQEEASQAQKDVSSAQAEVARAEASLSEASSKVTAQEGVVAKAQTKANETAQALQSAESKVASLSTTTDVGKLEQDVTALEAKVAEDKQAVSSAETSLESARLAESNKVQAIDSQKKVVAGAETTLDGSAKAYSDAITAQKDAQSTEERTKSALGAVNVLPIPEGYVEALRTYLANKTPENQAVLDRIGRQAFTAMGIPEDVDSSYLTEPSLYDKYNVGNFSAEDWATVVDPSNLSPTQRMDLALFVAGLVNPVREAYGVEPFVVSDAMMRISEITNKTAKWDGNHDLDAIARASEDVIGALPKPYKHYNTLYENMSTPILKKDGLTMGNLKRQILAGILQMLYADNMDNLSEYRHASNFLTPETRLGVSVIQDRTRDFWIGYPSRILYHIMYKSREQFVPNDTLTPVSTDVSSLQDAYNKAVQANNTAKANLTSAESAYTSAQQALAKAQKQLSDLQSGTVNISALETALVSAEAQLAKDSMALESARGVLASAKADASTKAKALEVAKKELEVARQANTEAQSVLAQEKEALDVLGMARSVASAGLAKAKDGLATASGVSTKATAKASDLAGKLAKKESVLADLNAKLTSAKAELARLLSELADAEAKLPTLVAERDRLVALRTEVQRLEAEKAKIERAEVGAVSAEMTSVKAQNPTSVTGQSVVLTKTAPSTSTAPAENKPAYSRVERAKTLPNTGTQDSLLGLLGASVMTGLMFIGKRRKES